MQQEFVGQYQVAIPVMAWVVTLSKYLMHSHAPQSLFERAIIYHPQILQAQIELRKTFKTMSVVRILYLRGGQIFPMKNWREELLPIPLSRLHHLRYDILMQHYDIPTTHSIHHTSHPTTHYLLAAARLANLDVSSRGGAPPDPPGKSIRGGSFLAQHPYHFGSYLTDGKNLFVFVFCPSQVRST